jgi:tripartite-type tricarboxylate transporter receptor subunit TctC
VPTDAAQRLNAAMGDALRDAEYRRQVEAAGSIPGIPMSLDGSDRFLAAQVARYRRIAQAVKLQPQ